MRWDGLLVVEYMGNGQIFFFFFFFPFLFVGVLLFPLRFLGRISCYYGP